MSLNMQISGDLIKLQIWFEIPDFAETDALGKEKCFLLCIYNISDPSAS